VRTFSKTALFSLLLGGCGDNQTIIDRDDYIAPDVAPLSCVPNLDGEISAGELAAAIGVPVRYLVSPAGITREVNTVGSDDGGEVVWDFSVDQADDQQIEITPQTTAGKWYESAFATDTFVTPFDAGGRVESVGRVDDDGLFLLGLASAEENPPEGQTLLIYDPPIRVLQFPVRPGSEFVSTGSISNGTLRGLPYAGSDSYAVFVDAAGRLELPQLSFEQVHRVRTQVTVQPSVGAATTQWQVSYFFECFGEVTRATSALDEPDPFFTVANEVRRLGFR
jgi:hypothetical protein